MGGGQRPKSDIKSINKNQVKAQVGGGSRRERKPNNSNVI
jgi:hypothetical protein